MSSAWYTFFIWEWSLHFLSYLQSQGIIWYWFRCMTPLDYTLPGENIYILLQCETISTWAFGWICWKVSDINYKEVESEWQLNLEASAGFFSREYNTASVLEFTMLTFVYTSPDLWCRLFSQSVFYIISSYTPMCQQTIFNSSILANFYRWYYLC